MKVRLLLTLVGVISFALPTLIAQDAMNVTPDQLVWKRRPKPPQGRTNRRPDRRSIESRDNRSAPQVSTPLQSSAAQSHLVGSCHCA
jgi:hypothetical protein